MSDSWIGVDLDGTLAEYHKWNGTIGAPIPAMVERVKAELAAGTNVRILTARACVAGLNTQEVVDEQRTLIEAWCIDHIGQVLPTTATKDCFMLECWDDRTRQVVPNTGKFIDEMTLSEFVIFIARRYS